MLGPGRPGEGDALVTAARPFSIETRYAGHRMRSRLEARWATFFDAIGMPWRYEADGVKLPSGRQYLPDFELGPFSVEVKGSDQYFDLARTHEYVQLVDRSLIVLGDIPRPGDPGLHVFWCCLNRSAGPLWRQWHWARYPDGTVQPLGYDRQYQAPIVDGVFCAVAGCRWTDMDEDPAVDAAYAAARSARFEWGEQGAG